MILIPYESPSPPTLSPLRHAPPSPPPRCRPILTSPLSSPLLVLKQNVEGQQGALAGRNQKRKLPGEDGVGERQPCPKKIGIAGQAGMGGGQLHLPYVRLTEPVPLVLSERLFVVYLFGGLGVLLRRLVLGRQVGWCL